MSRKLWFSGFFLKISSQDEEMNVKCPEYDSGHFYWKRMALKKYRKKNSGYEYGFIPISIAAAIFIWYLIIWMGDLQPFILPTPLLVWERFIQTLSDGRLLKHSLVTFGEVFSGLMLGTLFASVLGYILAKSSRLERLLSPYIVASQSVPVVAIAPLLIIWFGSGQVSKIMICALIVFFPKDLMRSLQANRWQTFKMLEVPSALPVLLGGIRIGATLSVIGAVVGEFVGADAGLGFLISLAKGQYDTALVFVAVFALVFMALALYSSVVLIEKKFLIWDKDQGDQIIGER